MWLFHCKVTYAYGGSHTAQLDIRNPVCGYFIAKSQTPMGGHTTTMGTSEIKVVIVALQGHTSLWRVHTAQLDIRNPVCGCFIAKSQTPMGGHTTTMGHQKSKIGHQKSDL